MTATRFSVVRNACLLLAYVMMSTIGTHALVLCFELDGQVVVETSTSGLSCEPENARPLATTVSLLMDSAPHCGPCVDLPLTSSLVSDRTSKFSDNPLVGNVAFQILSFPPAGPLVTPPSNHPARSEFRPSPVLYTLRTVLLLI